MTRMIAFLAAVFGGIGAFVSMRWLTKSRESTPWEKAAAPGKTVDVDGVTLHYIERAPPARSRGNVPAIVMIHGFGGHTFSYRYQLEAFGKDYRCVAIDLKGFGYSERSDSGDYSMTEQARLVLRAMDLLGIERATLIGHSLGGEVAMRIAASSPERVERLILAASVSGDRVPLAPRLPFMKAFLPAWGRVTTLTTWRRMFYDRSKVDLEAIRQAYSKPLRIYGTGNTIWEMWADTRKDKHIAYAAITAPVLILWAERERIIPLASVALNRLRKHFPKAEVVRIPRTGHLLLEENPEDSNAAIRRFLGSPADTAPPVEPEAHPVAQPA